MTAKKPATKKANSKSISKVPFSDGVGKTLRRVRLANDLKYEDVVAETRIQKDYLKAIEASDYKNLPHTVHSLGFIRRYARLLGLNGEVAVQKYLAERGPLPMAEHLTRRAKLKNPIFGSRLAVVFIIIFIMLAVIGYLLWQLRILAAPPQLSLSKPANNASVIGPSVSVAGSTTPGASVSVNGELVYVDDNGRFSTSLSLPAGLDQITVVAQNSHHLKNQITYSVLVKLYP